MQKGRQLNAAQGVELFPIVHPNVRVTTGSTTSQCAKCCAKVVRSSASTSGNSRRRMTVWHGQSNMVNESGTISALAEVREVCSSLNRGERLCYALAFIEDVIPGAF